MLKFQDGVFFLGTTPASGSLPYCLVGKALLPLDRAMFGASGPSFGTNWLGA